VTASVAQQGGGPGAAGGTLLNKNLFLKGF